MAEQNSKTQTDRRAFLKGAGKYAVLVPPAMTFLLSTTLVSEAVAGSSHSSGGYDGGKKHQSYGGNYYGSGDRHGH